MGAASGAAALGGAALLHPDSVGWTALGWVVPAAGGVAGGAWIAREHGRPGSGFVVAMGSAMILRSAAALGVLALALKAGKGAHVPCLVGLAAGFVPQMLFEVAWFHRRGRSIDR